VNWEQGKMLIHSPKTERHEGRESRIIPIFPEILPHLQDVFDNANPGTKWVITRYRRDNQNLRTQLQRIFKKAGINQDYFRTLEQAEKLNLLLGILCI